MKKLVLFILAVPLLLPVSAFGQNHNTAKAITMSGRVSEDGKSLITKTGEFWSVMNPGTLAEHVGQQVNVKCQIASAAHDIRVLSVKTVATPATFHPNPGDSAFRR